MQGLRREIEAKAQIIGIKVFDLYHSVVFSIGLVCRRVESPGSSTKTSPCLQARDTAAQRARKHKAAGRRVGRPPGDWADLVKFVYSSKDAALRIVNAGDSQCPRNDPWQVSWMCCENAD